MIADFVFFMGIAAICFSGMLFCLWNLGERSSPSSFVHSSNSSVTADKTLWPLKKIVWLMVQIWFGNTSLSFSQAESFHKVFGPILMTTFAALSNTLLLTSGSACWSASGDVSLYYLRQCSFPFCRTPSHGLTK